MLLAAGAPSAGCNPPSLASLQVLLWNMNKYTLMRKLEGHHNDVVSCDFSPDGALLATAAFSGSSWWIDLWDPYTAEKLATLV